MATDEKCLNCSLSPERPSWAYRCGVFFDVVNKTDSTILITGLTAGSHGGDREATLYACTQGASSGHETVEADWNILWAGMLKERSSTGVRLHVLLELAPYATQGLLLVSKDYAVYHTTNQQPMEDDSIRICAGVRSTEHRGNKNPFDPAAHSTREKATHAGSISYIFGKSYIVNCEASAPDGDELVLITCSNLAGSEIAKFLIHTSEDISKLHAFIATQLSSQLSDVASLQLKLVAPDGSLLSDGTSIADAFVTPMSSVA